MNDKDIVDHMIKFIEDKEKEFQVNTMENVKSKLKSDIVKDILDELESVLKNEN